MTSLRRFQRRRSGLAGRARATLANAVREFFADDGLLSAAAISYYALFSLFPLAILLVAGFGAVVDGEAARREVIAFVLGNVPLTEDQGRGELEDVLTSVTRSAGGFGIAGGVGLLIAASGVMGAIRKALNRAWDVDDRRPFVQGKIVDVLLVLGLGLLVALSFSLTLVARLAASWSAELEQTLGSAGSFVPRVVLSLDSLVPALVAFAVCSTLYRLVPVERTRLRDIAPGAALAALGFEAAKSGFALYLANFANYSAVYASLAAVVAFLVFVFVSANVLLLGAEVAVAWPRVRDGEIPLDDDTPLRDKLRDGLRTLFVRRRGT